MQAKRRNARERADSARPAAQQETETRPLHVNDSVAAPVPAPVCAPGASAPGSTGSSTEAQTAQGATHEPAAAQVPPPRSAGS